MKLKINEIESFSGLPNLVDEDGLLVCVPVNQAAAEEIVKRVNAYEASAGASRFFPRDGSKSAEQQGAFRKFDVVRVDGQSAPGEKHHGCTYFVLDLDHDQFAKQAMQAYGAACQATHPLLARDIFAEHGKPDTSTHDQLVKALRHIVACDPFKQSSAGIVARSALADAGLTC